MAIRIRRQAVIGGIVGLIFALAILIMARLNDGWNNEALGNIINFSASIPVFHLMKGLDLPELATQISFFAYWVLLGGIIGWLLCSKKALSKIVLVILIVVLVISHRFVQVKLEGELKAAMDALGGLFTGEYHLEEIKK